MRSGTAPLATGRRRTCRRVLPLASSCVARVGMRRMCFRGAGGPVVHHAPCQPQRTVAVSNENGQAHTVRTIALSVVPFYDLFTESERIVR